MCATCRHIMPSGLRCQSPAMRGIAFCYHHGRHIPPTHRSASPTEGRVEIPAVLDRQGIALAVNHVLQSLSNGRISARRASVLLYGLQMVVAHPADCDSAPDDPSPDLLPGGLFASMGISEEETISLINSWAHKMGMDASIPAEPPDTPPCPTPPMRKAKRIRQ